MCAKEDDPSMHDRAAKALDVQIRIDKDEQKAYENLRMYLVDYSFNYFEELAALDKIAQERGLRNAES